ncbi:anti-sigma-K factor RskA [Branchiibius hedensis]|uniref:Regulator of SigK n=1 Tax=Branchiibius hedensis TaxID=672460 RepID=A0A2Y9BU57_9MICO|nr:anti-sigma factor [Branchiibius hedensis]PWJ26360.1 anti-sigma-K factor RskA [Branchiibius hedensis]SSA35172.1 Anti-sigma-K factor RskA [Branchiibius hedensis]
MSEHIEAVDYVMDALDPAERSAAEQHLATCAECRGEVAQFQELTAALGKSVPPVDPPARLRDNVLAQVSTTPQDNVRTLSPRRRGRWLAAAAAAVVLAGGATTVALWPQTPTTISAVQQVESAADATTFTAPLGDGTMRIVASKSLNRSVIRLSDVSDLPSGKVYQAWMIADNRPVSAGVVTPGQDTVMKGSPNAATGAAVTVEPAGGSQEPTTTPVSSVSFG